MNDSPPALAQAGLSIPSMVWRLARRLLGELAAAAAGRPHHGCSAPGQRLRALTLGAIGALAACAAGPCLAAWSSPEPTSLGSAPVVVKLAPMVLAPRNSPAPADGRTAGEAPVGYGQTLQTHGSNEAWIALALRSGTGSGGTWILEYAAPGLDDVTLFEWMGDRYQEIGVAGDRIPMQKWFEPNRYPVFPLEMAEGQTRRFAMRVRNLGPIAFQVRAIPELQARTLDARENLVLGLTVGALLLMAVTSLVQGAVYQHLSSLYFGLTSMVMAACLLALTGAAGRFLWGDFQGWNNGAKAALGPAAAACYILLVRQLCGRAFLSVWIPRVSMLVFGAVMLVAALNAFTGGNFTAAAGLATLAGTLTVLATAALAWYGKDRTGLWILVAHIPLALVSLIFAARALGFVNLEIHVAEWFCGAVTFESVTFLTLLHFRSRTQFSLLARARSRDKLDALTGLLTPEVFAARLRSTAVRASKGRVPAAVLYVRFDNFLEISQEFGTAVGERSMIRAALMIQGAVPDLECCGRVDACTVALILESAATRSAAHERGSRIVAAGLAAQSGPAPSLPLRFFVATCVLGATGDRGASRSIHDQMMDALTRASTAGEGPVVTVEVSAPERPLPGSAQDIVPVA